MHNYFQKGVPIFYIASIPLGEILRGVANGQDNKFGFQIAKAYALINFMKESALACKAGEEKCPRYRSKI